MKQLILLACLTLVPAMGLAEIHIESAWARLLPPGVTTTAGYMELSSSESDSLLSASSPAAAMVEIHQTGMENGVMSMSEVDRIVLTAGQTLSLAPGGYHLMIMGLKESLKEGARLPVLLEFEKAGAVSVELIVTKK